MTLGGQVDFETNTNIVFAPNGCSKSVGAPCNKVPKSNIVNGKHVSVFLHYYWFMEKHYEIQYTLEAATETLQRVFLERAKGLAAKSEDQPLGEKGAMDPAQIGRGRNQSSTFQ